MDKSDPFGFDISVSAAKKKKTRGKRGMSGAFETSQRVCEHPGCQESAQYRAPKSPDELDEYKWFCKDHVREYNLKWNFFNGATEEEIEEQAQKDRVWERETKPFKQIGRGAGLVRGSGSTTRTRCWARTPPATRARRSPASRKLPPTERKAIEILEATDTWTKTEMRKAYKALIKVLHPDMNGGDRSQEEQLQEVVWAWDQIKESRHFK